MDNDFTYGMQDGRCILLAYHGTAQDLVLPDQVQCIGRNAFSSCHTIRRVTIPKSVQVIGARAFENCSALDDVVFTYPGVFVDEYAFYGTPYWDRLLKEAASCAAGADPSRCPERLILPEGSTHIDGWYYSRSRISSAYLPSSLRTIGVSAFQGCSRLKSVSMSPNTYCNSRQANGAADGIFSHCENLEVIEFRGALKNFTWYDAAEPELLRGFDPEKTFFGCNRLKRMIGYEIPLSCYPSQWKRYAIQGYLSDIERKVHYLADVSHSYDEELLKMKPQLIRRTVSDHSPALHQYLITQKMLDFANFDQVLTQAVQYGDADVISMLLEYQNRELKYQGFGDELLSEMDEL
jgi:hypothetical protein